MFSIKNMLPGPQTLTWMSELLHPHTSAELLWPQPCSPNRTKATLVLLTQYKERTIYKERPYKYLGSHLWPVLREFSWETPMLTNWVNVWNPHCISGGQSVQWNARRNETNWLAYVGYKFCSKYRHLGAFSFLLCLIFHGENCLDELYSQSLFTSCNWWLQANWLCLASRNPRFWKIPFSCIIPNTLFPSIYTRWLNEKGKGDGRMNACMGALALVCTIESSA